MADRGAPRYGATRDATSRGLFGRYGVYRFLTSAEIIASPVTERPLFGRPETIWEVREETTGPSFG